MNDRIRASDADRERVTDRLRDHYAEGRLAHDELDERIAAALNAKTFGDLRHVLADLPEPRPLVPTLASPAARPYPVPFRRGPGLLPVLAFVLLLFVVLPSAAAVALKALAIALAVMFAFVAVTAFLAARFIHRARRRWHGEQFGNWPLEHWHSAHWRHGHWHTRDWHTRDWQ